MRQVLGMKAAGDIEFWSARFGTCSRSLDYDFVSCAFLLIGNERNWLSSYNVWSEQTTATLYSPDSLGRKAPSI